MPELPEVETIRLGLQKKIVGLKINNIKISNSKSFQEDPKLLQGKKVLDIWRKAKILGIELASDLTLLIHLKMSGQLIYQGKEKFIGGHPTKDMLDEMPNRSTRVIFEFDDGSKLYFNDQRKFGWIKLMDNGQLKMDKFLNKLGPEPLEKRFTWLVLKENLLKHKYQSVKIVLLDQSVVAGIGNIYACEGCFLGNIDPRTKVSDLSEHQIRRLHKGIIDSLKAAIAAGGSSKTHFINEDGVKGKFLDYAYVYDRQGKLCKKCKTTIKKIKLGGRGTYYCPECQR